MKETEGRVSPHPVHQVAKLKQERDAAESGQQTDHGTNVRAVNVNVMLHYINSKQYSIQNIMK